MKEKKIVAAGNRTRYLARARRVQWELNCERAEEGENSYGIRIVQGQKLKRVYL